MWMAAWSQMEEEHFLKSVLAKYPEEELTLAFGALSAEKFSFSQLEGLKKALSPEEYAVTQKNQTERAFSNRYWDKFESGIYVDVAEFHRFCSRHRRTHAKSPRLV